MSERFWPLDPTITKNVTRKWRAALALPRGIARLSLAGIIKRGAVDTELGFD